MTIIVDHLPGLGFTETVAINCASIHPNDDNTYSGTFNPARLHS